MKLFGSRFFILFLVLTVGLFFFSAKATYAGGVVNAISSVFNAIVTVINTVVNAVVGALEVVIGTVIGGPLLSDGNCRLQNLSDNVFQVYGDSCNTSASIVITSTDVGCSFSYQPKFYIPQKDVGFQMSTRLEARYDDQGNIIFPAGSETGDCYQTTINENNNN
ncbi:MAG: hypothetical protein AAB494_00395, partial [Patescibacteria group bacterium]